MPYYMHQWRYKDEQIREILMENKDRSEVVRIAIEAFGGTLEAFYYSFGEYDGVAISRFSDPEAAFASLLAISGQGRISALQTTTLFAADEGLRAIRVAREIIGTDHDR